MLLDLRQIVNHTKKVQTYRIEYNTTVQGLSMEVTLAPNERLADAFKKQYDEMGGLYYNIKKIESATLVK